MSVAAVMNNHRQGSMGVDVQSSRTTTIIWLNAAELDIQQGIARTPSGVEQMARREQLQPPRVPGSPAASEFS